MLAKSMQTLCSIRLETFGTQATTTPNNTRPAVLQIPRKIQTDMVEDSTQITDTPTNRLGTCPEIHKQKILEKNFVLSIDSINIFLSYYDRMC